MTFFNKATRRPKKPSVKETPVKSEKSLPRGSEKAKKPISVAKLDREFSKYIRARDSAEFGGTAFRCITCQKIKPFEQSDCGHYLGRQYFATRWNDVNCASQCRFDNRFNEGMKQDFRAALVKKHGEAEILKLEAGHKSGRKPKPYEMEMILAEIKGKAESLRVSP